MIFDLLLKPTSDDR